MLTLGRPQKVQKLKILRTEMMYVEDEKNPKSRPNGLTIITSLSLKSMNMRAHFILVLLGISLPLAIKAQDLRLSNNIPVNDFFGQPLEKAWAGGNSSPQYSDVDLNQDGFKDLVVFDRIGYFFTTYLNDGLPGQISYTYAPEYMKMFEHCDCKEWALMVDYTCDGIEDLICGAGSAGQQLAAYKNTPLGTDSIQFIEQIRPITHPFFTAPLELYTTLTDIPALVDVDYDGDLDIISTQPSSNRWALYRNLAMEDSGRCDTLIMEYDTSCWAHFGENFNNDSLILADTFVCPRSDRSPYIPSGGTRHEGGTILVLDTNADSLMDALISDVSYNTAVLAINQGTIYDALMVDAEYRYPKLDSSINVTIFPGLFHLDVNNDNIRDFRSGSPSACFSSFLISSLVIFSCIRQCT